MTHLLLFLIGRTALSSCCDKPCHAGTHYCLTTVWKSPTKQSVFEIIYVKLANFEANIFKAQGDFLKSFARSVEGNTMIFEDRA